MPCTPPTFAAAPPHTEVRMSIPTTRSMRPSLSTPPVSLLRSRRPTQAHQHVDPPPVHGHGAAVLGARVQPHAVDAPLAAWLCGRGRGGRAQQADAALRLHERQCLRLDDLGQLALLERRRPKQQALRRPLARMGKAGKK
eukprot:68459-Prymnesium_polylepis.1